MKGICSFLFMGISCSLFSCTNILVTKGASTDGSVFVSHSDDGSLTDQRMIFVPARDYEPGSKRAVYFDDAAFGSTTHRYVGKDRGPGYDDPSLTPSKPLGYIDQVAHTHADFDGNYGIMNEHQLMIGEATNGVKFEPQPKAGERIFFSSELTRVALERCTTAADAVRLIGDLIDQYGFYGPGEALFLADPDEGWLMEICAGTSEKSKGLWVAKKIPDGEVCIIANEFRIREVDPNDPNMKFSKNLFDELQKSGWWDPKKGKLDWLKAVSFGELNHPYYSLRRIWRVTQKLQPSKHYSPWVADGFTKEYPISFKPEHKLSVSDVMALHRDHYEGTPFDLTKGLAAGPFGCPYRFNGPYDGSSENVSEDKKMWGAWERAISVYNVGYIYVNQARRWMPDAIGGICWYGPDKPYLTCLAPFYVGITDLPAPYQTCDILKFDRNSAWWTFNFASNLAALKFSYMKQDIIDIQQKTESQELRDISSIDEQALSMFKNDPCEAASFLTNFCTENSEHVLASWWELSNLLIAKYADGYINVPKLSESVGYPKIWLKDVKYKEGPITYKKYH
jgi:dipeptidase